MAGRFHEDTSLDRATHLKEVQELRAARLAEVDERDKQAAADGEKTPFTPCFNLLLNENDTDGGPGERQVRLLHDAHRVLEARSTSPHDLSPIFRQSASAAKETVGTSILISPRRPVSSHSKENRQAANERAVEIYSAGGIGDRRPRPPRRAESTSASGVRPMWNVRRLISAEGRRATTSTATRCLQSSETCKREGECKVRTYYYGYLKACSGISLSLSRHCQFQQLRSVSSRYQLRLVGIVFSLLIAAVSP